MTAANPSYCQQQVEKFDNDRFLCAAYAPPAEREGLLALYAFNLEIAQIREHVREPMLGQVRLQWWRETLDRIGDGEEPSHPVAAALAAAMRRFSLDRAPLDRYLDGRARDLEDAAPADLAALEDYVDATAASLSAVALRVVGVDEAAAKTAMRHVAIAWALIGLMRAVPFHARARRIYLPAALNREAGLDAWALFETGETAGVTEVVRQVIDAAEDHLRQARHYRQSIPRAALPVMLIATLADHYLTRLRQSGNNPFGLSVRGRSRRAMIRLAVNAAIGRF